MQVVFMVLFAAVIAVADQLVKYFVLTHIPLFGTMELFPGVVGLTYVQNYGAAFSSLQGMRWLFVVILVVFVGVVIWEYKVKYMPFTTFERWCIASICGGGIGNMIDRVRFGFVVDMFRTEFMNFPIFNVADCFITCGGIALVAHLVFFNKEFWKDEKKK